MLVPNKPHIDPIIFIGDFELVFIKKEIVKSNFIF